ncbi:GIY-YIG nuclease family protein [Brevibacillus sp. SYSU BS000544]|uniref:GIY-YIG nuclease family protein n=1 Tax=Brevibacillus sp. SYSU BS000544 TaxID=3416443 RepID=UPI003CE4B539
MNLQEKLKNLPSSPGVYLMKDSLGTIIYVGKAKNLKNRVQSYFHNSKAHSPKVKKLVQIIKDLELILTDTEFEAFMLECKLIQDLKPHFNKKMKSPLSYPYIGIEMEHGLRSLVITNHPGETKGNLYFGPYTASRTTVERALQGIKEYCKILCSSPSSKHTACLNHSLGLCIGMCAGGSAVEEYNRMIKRIADLLDGSDKSLLEEIKRSMFEAAESFEFETAAKYRNTIDAINSLINKEKVIEFTIENQLIAVIEHLHDRTAKFFLIKQSEILYREKYDLESTDIEYLLEKIKTNILDIFKAKPRSFLSEVSRNEIDEAQIIYSYLHSNSCSFFLIPDKWLLSKDTARFDEALRELLISQKPSK